MIQLNKMNNPCGNHTCISCSKKPQNPTGFHAIKRSLLSQDIMERSKFGYTFLFHTCPGICQARYNIGHKPKIIRL
ncbi:uncharacterized protein LOC116300493 isoform X2 [Actinia tenebrosa]|uniref:Uncharacterized protein LOC116300493 isoform X2 n=1 Tax=Actinia tenebrosa TaxID=6105 RepID=A0A6P8ICE3_ACTTE|nr:uncharacterized protein LOC116300493 isoform X2 [Actinia tenebrosa]XP_031565231.1 uncharacterized protein LOC116300493 isoform X2 [Actinia tenebrosa]